MDNDITYLVVMVLGTISSIFLGFSNHILQKLACLIFASIMFIQAGVCIYDGVNGLHRKMKNKSSLMDSEAKHIKLAKRWRR